MNNSNLGILNKLIDILNLNNITHNLSEDRKELTIKTGEIKTHINVENIEKGIQEIKEIVYPLSFITTQLTEIHDSITDGKFPVIKGVAAHCLKVVSKFLKKKI
jgi:hypothetical protein